MAARTVDINLVPPSLWKNGKTELQSQKMVALTTLWPWVQPGLQHPWGSPRPVGGADSLQEFRHLLVFRLNSKTKCWKEAVPSNQCVQVFQ